ncbi:hypothetical protein EON63_23960 [archaeon]|nr:MAG: hypothetical protein EON63_23960 [archaeon]
MAATPFSSQNDSALLAALRETFNAGSEVDWKAVADMVRDQKTPEDCAHRWASLVKNRRRLNTEVNEVLTLQRQIKPVCSRGLYTAEEDEKLLRALRDCMEEKRRVCWKEGWHTVCTPNTYSTYNSGIKVIYICPLSRITSSHKQTNISMYPYHVHMPKSVQA